MWRPSRELADHPDRLRWNARYGGDYVPSFRPHSLAVAALALAPATGPVLELAAGPSGSALLAAGSGRAVTVVDASDVALGLLSAAADRRGVSELITLTHADLSGWQPAGQFALVLCTNFWERPVFGRAVRAVAAGGVLAWEALTEAARATRPDLPAQWCLRSGEPASLLPAGFDVIDQHDVPGESRKPGIRRQLLARRLTD